MKNNHLLTGFTGVSFLAIVGMVLLFQNSTMSAKVIDDSINAPEFEPAVHERFLAREPCKYVNVILDLKYEDCHRLGRLQCNQAYKVKPNYKGDAYVPSLNCLRQCIRDVQAQCEHASSDFIQEGKR